MLRGRIHGCLNDDWDLKNRELMNVIFLSFWFCHFHTRSSGDWTGGSCAYSHTSRQIDCKVDINDKDISFHLGLNFHSLQHELTLH